MYPTHNLFPLVAIAILLSGLFLPAQAQEAANATATGERPAASSGSLFESVDLSEEPMKPGEEFTVPGLFSIATPSGGFEWKELENPKETPQPIRWFLCSKPAYTGSIVVGVEMRTVESDAAKVTVLAGHYNSLLDRLQQKGFTQPKPRKPSLSMPVPESVDYEIVARTPGGAESIMYGKTLYGNRVYMFHVAAQSREEIDSLLKTVETFKDLSPPMAEEWRGEVVGNEFIVPGEFSIAAPGNGYEWALAQASEIDGKESQTYICSKEGTPSTVVLNSIPLPEGSNDQLRTLVGKSFEAVANQLRAKGYTEIQERAPDTSAPGNRFTFALRGKDPEGQVSYMFGLTTLGRRLFTLHMVSPSQEEARELHKVVNSFKELPAS